MITITNRQRKIKFDTEAFKKDAQTLLDVLKYSDFDLGILLTTNKSIRTYNHDYRNKDKATDILSFPYHSELQPGERIKPETDEDKNLGDLIISLEYVVKAAQELGTTFEKRMRVLLVHGICHLMCYDHETDEEYAVMKKKEKFLLDKLNTVRPI